VAKVVKSSWDLLEEAIKAGVMEIGDVFAINKADRDGAKRTAREIDMMLDFNHSDWRPPVTMCIAIKNEGIDELLKGIHDHMDYMKASGKFNTRRQANAKSELIELVKEQVMYSMLGNEIYHQMVIDFSEQVASRKVDPYTASDQILKAIKHQF